MSSDSHLHDAMGGALVARRYVRRRAAAAIFHAQHCIGMMSNRPIRSGRRLGHLRRGLLLVTIDWAVSFS